MPDVTLPYPNFVPGTTIDSEQVDANLAAIVTALNDLDAENLSPALAALLGVSQSGAVRRGKSIVSTEESRTNVAYGKLATPDQVTGITLPTDGLLIVRYQAMWKESSATSARAAIFLGSDQLKVQDTVAASPVASEACLLGSTNTYYGLFAHPAGLAGFVPSAAAVYTGDVTTGQASGATAYSTATGFLSWLAGGNIHQFDNHATNGRAALGGVCEIHSLPAGSYDVSVQFKSAAGSVTVKNRKLWVEAVGF